MQETEPGDVISKSQKLPQHLLAVQLPEDTLLFQADIGCIHI